MKKTLFLPLFLKPLLTLFVLCCLLSALCQAQWQPDVRLTYDTGSSYTSLNNAWCIAASGNVVHVVWYDDRDGYYAIYHKRSTDAGLSWGADIRLTNNTAGSGLPSVTVSGQVVHVVWDDYRDGNEEIYYKRSTDAGVSWGADTRLTNNPADSEYPSVSVSGQVVHVVWNDDRDGNYERVYYKRSTDGGVSWGADTRLTNYSADSWFPSVTVSGQVVHVVWGDNRDVNSEIYYKRSTDAGVSWGADTRLTNDSAGSGSPSVSVSGQVVHVVWDDGRDLYPAIYYKRSTDAGVSWGADTRLTINPASSWYPSVSVSGQVVHIVWNVYDWNYDIYYKRSTDAGVSWEADTRLTNNSAYSWYPSVSVSGQVVHVVWHDKRDGNFEIYYKRNPTGNSIGIITISNEIPYQFRLSQNYPNPFNPKTKIRFDIPADVKRETSNVRLIIFDVMGREVATLVNEPLKPGTPASRSLGAGRYEVEWDGTNYPSGVYFYRLSAGDYSETRKMVLIK